MRRRIETSDNVGDGCDAIAWIQSLIPDKTMVTFTADKAVSAFQQYLIPFYCSVNNRPDGIFLKRFNTVTLPLFILEVHSSPYKNSVSQTAVDLLQQFRLLRCFDHNYNTCVGFTFPKYGEKTAVTKVIVSFEQFQFMIRLKPLCIDVVKDEIQALAGALHFECVDCSICFLRFSDEELCTIKENLTTEVIEQSTMHSILLKSADGSWFFNATSPRQGVLSRCGMFSTPSKTCNGVYRISAGGHVNVF